MAFTKFASFEVSQVLDVKGSSERQRTASLDKLADYDDFRTDDGYMYARIIAISSRVNKNNDGWPSVELAGGQDVWDKISGRLSKTGSVTLSADSSRKSGFSTFVGKPIFVDHNNSNPKRLRGVIADSKLHVDAAKTSGLDPYYSSNEVDYEHLPPTRVELLLEIDAKAFPKLASAIRKGDIDGFSMGCDVESTKCSHCGKVANSPVEYCSHIVSKGALHNFKEADGSERMRRSYENCYGIKFFEISAVFDPADETALLQELVDEPNHREANLPPEIGQPNVDPDQILQMANEMSQKTGLPLQECLDLAERKIKQNSDDLNYIPVRGGDTPPNRTPRLLTEGWGGQLPNNVGLGPVRQGSYLSAVKQADNPLPQFMHTNAPEDVDTLREEKVCPVCGEDMENEKCDVCGYVEEPDGFNNPDLSKARGGPELGMEDPNNPSDASPNVSQDGLLDGAPDPGTADATSYLDSKKKAKPPALSSERSKVAGKINTVETPIKPSTKPATNEPKETVLSDQTKPVTSAFRTAMDLIQAAKQAQSGENMSDRERVAAEPADSSGKAQKQVDVNGVGGVIDATNEKASEPTGPNSYENAGATVDVTGKGGIIEDSNAEASRPSDGTESLPSGEQDNAGFQNGGQKGDKTRTWDNSNEPGSAVTDKAFPTAAVEAAKGGTKPIGPSDVQPSKRVDLEQDGPTPGPQSGTDQWTGTGGNGVTRQQDPVTRKVDPNIQVSSFSHVVAAMKLADAEVELGLVEKDKKYDRVAELEGLTPEELAAEERVISRVRTAGLAKQSTRREASTREGEVAGRVPSFKRVGSSAPAPVKVTDEIGDSALFIR